MKKTNRILSMLLSLILLFSLMAVNASAEGGEALPVQPGALLTVAEPVFEGSSNEGQEEQNLSCEISLVYHGNDGETTENSPSS